MKINKKTRFYNFTIELLIMIVFFIMASIVCVMLFVSGVGLKDKAIKKNEALLKAQSLVEEYRSCKNIKDLEYIEDDFKVVISLSDITKGQSNTLYEYEVAILDLDFGNELVSLTNSCMQEVNNEE